MELDEFKNIWNSTSNQNEQQLSSEIIEQMVKRKYYSKVKKIAYPEFIGIAICLSAAVFIGLNIYQLDTVFLRGTAIVSIITLLALSIISFLSLRPFNNIKDVNVSYVDTLKTFAFQRVRFYTLQRVNVLLSYLLMVTFVILLSKLFRGVDLTENKYFWMFSFTFGYIFVLFYSKWVMKYYKTTLEQAEELLKELSAR